LQTGRSEALAGSYRAGMRISAPGIADQGPGGLQQPPHTNSSFIETTYCSMRFFYLQENFL
jgi:hypothetical protein